MEDLVDPKYTRVSQILSVFQNYAHIPRAKLKRAQDIGTHIHSAIEAYYNGKFEPLSVTKDGYFKSFLAWTENFKFEPFAVEKRFFDDNLMITGRIDLVMPGEDGICLVDFKTGSLAHPEIWELQGTFYRHLLKFNGWELLPSKFVFVQLKSDGSYPLLHEFYYDPYHDSVCIAALKCYHFLNKRGVDVN